MTKILLGMNFPSAFVQWWKKSLQNVRENHWTKRIGGKTYFVEQRHAQMIYDVGIRIMGNAVEKEEKYEKSKGSSSIG